MTSKAGFKFLQLQVQLGLLFTCLNTWSPAVGAVLGNAETLGSWGLTGGRGH